MGLFDKEKIANLANKTLEKSKQVAQFAAEKANEHIEMQKNKNKVMFQPLNGAFNSEIRKFTVVGEYYYKDNISTLGTYDEEFGFTKPKLIKLGLYGWEIFEYDFSKDYQVTLEFEPKNPHDPNAIKVLLDDVHVGYIASGEAAEIRQLIKHGIVGIDAVIKGSARKVLLHNKYDNKGYVDFKRTDYVIELSIALK